MDSLKFKGWLVEHNIKQGDLAKLLDITVENVNAKLNGKQNFTLSQIKTICSTYSISADEFFF
jgi:transcriptional regulator with XRE-family HTH domain